MFQLWVKAILKYQDGSDNLIWECAGFYGSAKEAWDTFDKEWHQDGKHEGKVTQVITFLKP